MKHLFKFVMWVFAVIAFIPSTQASEGLVVKSNPTLTPSVVPFSRSAIEVVPADRTVQSVAPVGMPETEVVPPVASQPTEGTTTEPARTKLQQPVKPALKDRLPVLGKDFKEMSFKDKIKTARKMIQLKKELKKSGKLSPKGGGNTFGIIGMVLGILSLLTVWLYFIGLGLAIVGLVFSIISLVRGEDSKIFGIIGIIASSLTILLWILLIAIVAAIVL